MPVCQSIDSILCICGSFKLDLLIPLSCLHDGRPICGGNLQKKTSSFLFFLESYFLGRERVSYFFLTVIVFFFLLDRNRVFVIFYFLVFFYKFPPLFSFD